MSCDQLLTRRVGRREAVARPTPERSVEMPRRIGVVGGGLKGLSVALELVRSFDAARLRRGGGCEPSITVLERDTETYDRYRTHHRAGGLLSSGAAGARELLAHVPSDPGQPVVGSVRVRPQAPGGAVLDRFAPVRVRLARAGGATPLPADAVPQNVRACVDAALEVDAARPVGAALDMWAHAMRREPGARDDCRAMLDPAHAVGRILRGLALVGGGGSGCGHSIVQAAASTGVLWPTQHAADERRPGEAGGGATEAATPLRRCASVADDVLVPIARLLRGLGVELRYGTAVVAIDAAAGRARARLADETVEFDLMVDARGDARHSTGGVLQLPPWLAAAYGARFADDGSTVVHPETPWRLVTTLRPGGTLEVRVGAVDAAGVRSGTCAAATAAQAATEVVLQLGFSLADAGETRWTQRLHEAGDDAFRGVAGGYDWPEARELVAFEVGQPTLPTSRVAFEAPRPVVGRLVVACRAGSTTRHGGPRSLGPPVEAAKLLVQELVHRLGLRDELRSAAAPPGAPASETLVCVPGLHAEGRMLPTVTSAQRWCLFNQLAVRLGVGYNAYVGQAVGASLVVAMLVLAVVGVPVAVAMRRRRVVPAAAKVAAG